MESIRDVYQANMDGKLINWEWKYFCYTLIIFLFFIPFVTPVSYRTQESRHCTYFTEGRLSKAEGNLINCSWYADNSCCKRTEVTSVFSSMYRLYGASEACKNQMNYIMCYFCSPMQYQWFKKSAEVCSSFCKSIYKECMNAEYNGKAIGEAYKDGKSFCEAQRFIYVERESNCFDFDPNVFGGASRLIFHPFILTFLVTMVFVILHNLWYLSS